MEFASRILNIKIMCSNMIHLDFFGDMAFLDNDPRSADAIAVVPVEVFAISRARFDEVVSQHPHVGVRVFALLSKALAVRLRYANNELRAAQEA